MGPVLQMRLRLQEGKGLIQVHCVVQPGLGPHLWSSKALFYCLNWGTRDSYRGPWDRQSLPPTQNTWTQEAWPFPFPKTGPHSPQVAAGDARV